MYKVWLKRLAYSFVITLVVISILYKFVVIDRVYSKVDFSLPQEVDTLVIGASHLEAGLSDLNYPNMNNYSNSGMPYYFTYPKAKRLIENNPQVKTLIISLSPIHVSPFGDSRLFTNDKGSRELSLTYFPLLDNYNNLENKTFTPDFLISSLKYRFGVPFNYMDDIKPFIKSLKRTIKFSEHNYSGSFSPIDKSILSMEATKAKADFYFGKKISYSDLSILAIKKIAELTEFKNIKLIILNMPHHESFRALTPIEYIQKQKQLINELLNDHSHIKYFDYYEYPLLDSDFYDGDHINSTGEKKFAEIIKREVFEN